MGNRGRVNNSIAKSIPEALGNALRMKGANKACVWQTILQDGLMRRAWLSRDASQTCRLDETHESAHGLGPRGNAELGQKSFSAI